MSSRGHVGISCCLVPQRVVLSGPWVPCLQSLQLLSPTFKYLRSPTWMKRRREALNTWKNRRAFKMNVRSLPGFISRWTSDGEMLLVSLTSHVTWAENTFYLLARQSSLVPKLQCETKANKWSCSGWRTNENNLFLLPVCQQRFVVSDISPKMPFEKCQLSWGLDVSRGLGKAGVM